MSLFGLGLHLAGCLSLLLIGGGAYLMLIDPLSQSIADAGQETQRLSRLVRTGASIQTRHQELSETLQHLKERTARVQERIPAGSQEAEFLEQLSEIARQRDITITDYRRQQVIEQETHWQLTVEVSADGDYPSLCEFLAGLHQLPRITSVTRMEIDGAAEKNERYPLRLNLVLYFGLKPAPVAEEGQRG